MPAAHRFRLVSALTIVALALSACGDGSTDQSDDGTTVLRIATSFYPITEIVDQVVEGLPVDIVQLTPPGTDVHGYELTARQLDDLSDADIVFHLSGGLQPTIEKAVSQLSTATRVVDLATSVALLSADSAGKEDVDGHDHDDHSDDAAGTSDEHDHGDTDPHVWLDPANMATMTRAVADMLQDALPSESATFTANADAYIAELDALGSEMDAAFTECASRALVTSHDAFRYLAQRVDLTTVPIAGISPDNEPSAKQLESIANVARDAGATTVFLENQLPDGLTRTVADAIGAEVKTISAAETMTNADLAAGRNYISRMRETITTIADGLGCA